MEENDSNENCTWYVSMMEMTIRDDAVNIWSYWIEKLFVFAFGNDLLLLMIRIFLLLFCWA